MNTTRNNVTVLTLKELHFFFHENCTKTITYSTIYILYFSADM